MGSRRSALIVGCAHYAERDLQALPAVGRDADALAEVLADPDIGGYEVSRVMDQPAHLVSRAIEEFFVDRDPEDLLLLHLSCHGVKDATGELYFAAADTQVRLLSSTAVPAAFVNQRMSRSRSRRVVLLLDCCYAGAFEKGFVAKSGGDLGLEERLGGRGRAVITASTAMEYAFVGGRLDEEHTVLPSVFTGALVQGLRSGDADRDLDGVVGLHELYDYVYDVVRDSTPNQTPSKWELGIQGDLVVARRAVPVAAGAPLEPELMQAVESPLAGVRAGAVRELSRILAGTHPGRRHSAEQALTRMLEDDSVSVRDAARTALSARDTPSPPTEPHTTSESADATPAPTADADSDEASTTDTLVQDRVPTAPEPAALPYPDSAGDQPFHPTRSGPAQGDGTARWTEPPPVRWWRRHALLSGLALIAALATALLLLLFRGSADLAPQLRDDVALMWIESENRLQAVSIDSGKPEYESDSDVRLPTISPNRRTVAVVPEIDGSAPQLVDADLTKSRPLFGEVAPCTEVSRPSWSKPGGEMIAITCLDGDDPFLLVGDVNYDEAERVDKVVDWQRVEPKDGDGQVVTPAEAPTWIGNDMLVVPAVTAAEPETAEPETRLWAIPVAADDGTASRLDVDPAIPPFENPDVHGTEEDGYRLLFLAGPRKSQQAWTAELDPNGTLTDRPEPLLNDRLNGATWGPDGSVLVVRADRTPAVVASPGETPTDIPEFEEPVGRTPAWGSR